MVFPFLSPYLNKYKAFDIVPVDALDYFADCVRQTIEMRKEGEGPVGVSEN